MATNTDNRPIPKTVAESEFDRGVGTSSYQSSSKLRDDQGSNAFWVYLIAAVVIAGGAYYYYSSDTPSVATPVITETVVPPVTTAPEATTPPVTTAPEATTPPVTTAPEATTPPVVAPDPADVPKVTP